MRVVVITKIADPRLRKDVLGKLKNRGLAVAAGVFECEFSHDELERLEHDFKKLRLGENDRVILQPVCAECAGKRVSIGGMPEAVCLDEWVII